MDDLGDVIITVCVLLILLFVIVNMLIMNTVLDDLHDNENCIKINGETYCKMGGE